MRPRPVLKARDDHAVGDAPRLDYEGLAVLVEAAYPADVAHLAEALRPDEHRLADDPRAVDGGDLALVRAPVGVVHLNVDVGGDALLIRHPRVEHALTVGGVCGTAPVGGYLVVLGAQHVFRIVVVVECVERGIARDRPDAAVEVFPGRGAAVRRRDEEVCVGGDGRGIDMRQREPYELGDAVLGRPLPRGGLFRNGAARPAVAADADARDGAGAGHARDRRRAARRIRVARADDAADLEAAFDPAAAFAGEHGAAPRDAADVRRAADLGMAHAALRRAAADYAARMAAAADVCAAQHYALYRAEAQSEEPRVVVGNVRPEASHAAAAAVKAAEEGAFGRAYGLPVEARKGDIAVQREEHSPCIRAGVDHGGELVKLLPARNEVGRSLAPLPREREKRSLPRLFLRRCGQSEQGRNEHQRGKYQRRFPSHACLSFRVIPPRYMYHVTILTQVSTESNAVFP